MSHPQPNPNSFDFTHVFAKKCPCQRLAPPLMTVGAPNPHGKSWTDPCTMLHFQRFQCFIFVKIMNCIVKWPLLTTGHLTSEPYEVKLFIYLFWSELRGSFVLAFGTGSYIILLSRKLASDFIFDENRGGLIMRKILLSSDEEILIWLIYFTTNTMNNI